MIDGLIDVVELNGDLVDYISLEGTLLPIGPKGDKGDPGEPGFSPQVDITKVGKATTLTIVDEQGTHQSVIYDGDGDMNKAVYDTDNDGIVDNAERVNGYTVATNVPADAQFTDTTYTAGVGIEITAGNVINNTQTSAEWGNISGDLEDQIDLQNALDNKADASDIPDSTSDLTNDSGFITNATNDLVNYYLKSETYTKSEVNNLISQIPGFAIQVVQTLPVSDIDPHTIYLVPSSSAGTQNVYDEFIYVNNSWEQIGSTEVDLTNYPTFTDYPTAGGRAGVIKNGFGMTIGSDSGTPSADVYSAYDYGLRDDHIFVSKGTLDNVLDAKPYITSTDYASNQKGGVIKTDTSTYGTSMYSGFLTGSTRTYAQYNSAANALFISKGTLENVIDGKGLADDTDLATKQDTLVSGTNIKTINNESLLGSGNIVLSADDEIAISTTQPTGNETVWIKSDETTNQARYKDGNTWKNLSIKALDSMSIGSIILFAGETIPTGWLICDGDTLNEEEYPELYDVIGYTYGGSGLDFNLPNFKGRVGVGLDTTQTEFDTIGETGGSKELQQHSHSLNMYATGSGTTSGTQVTTTGALFQTTTTYTAGTGNSGNLQPYLVVNYIIKATNTTPTMASVVNAYNTSTTDAYSCDYINKLSTYPSTSAGEIVIGQTTDGTPVYRKTIYITQQNQPHGISNLFAVISTNAILNNFDYGWVNVSYDVVIQGSNIWLRDRALNNVNNGILLTIEYYKSTD